MTWERTPHRSVFHGERFDLVAYEYDGRWQASIGAHGGTGVVIFTVPTLPGSTRDEAETAAICAARELSAELALMARKASLP